MGSPFFGGGALNEICPLVEPFDETVMCLDSLRDKRKAPGRFAGAKECSDTRTMIVDALGAFNRYRAAHWTMVIATAWLTHDRTHGDFAYRAVLFVWVNTKNSFGVFLECCEDIHARVIGENYFSERGCALLYSSLLRASFEWRYSDVVAMFLCPR